MGILITDKKYFNQHFVFKDRFDAGKRLGEWLRDNGVSVDVVYAIPSGGVPIGYMVARILGSKLDVLVCRKLLIPWNTEAGFGAVDPEGNYFVDRELALYLGLTEEEIRRAVEKQVLEIERRITVFRGNKDYSGIRGKRILLVDDGIAAGYTMMAALGFVKKKEPKEVIVAVPTCHLEAARRLQEHADRIYCLNPREETPYAVADAYIEWHDLSEGEVLEVLYKAWKERILNYDIRVDSSSCC